MVGIFENERIIYKKGFGMQSISNGLRITENTKFSLASVSKQFACLAIALLEEEGKLSFEDDIRKYLPEIDYEGIPIKINHLMYHTSGVKSFPVLVALANEGRIYFKTKKELFTLIKNQKSLNFLPGNQ